MTTMNKWLAACTVIFGAAFGHGCFDPNASAIGTLQVGEACGTSSECARGLECEVEHGVGTCQPHGGGGRDGGTSSTGDDDGGSSSDGGSSDSGSASAAAGDGSSDRDAEDEDSGRGSDDDAGRDDDGGDRTDDDSGSSGSGAAAEPTALTSQCVIDDDCPRGFACKETDGAMLCLPQSGSAATMQTDSGKPEGAVCDTTYDCRIGLRCKWEGDQGVCREVPAAGE